MKPTRTSTRARGQASVRNLPVSLFACVMGLSGLSLAWRVAHDSLAAPAWIDKSIGALALCVFLLLALAYAAKIVRHPQAVRAEFNHPVAGSFFGTIAISVLLLSAVIGPYSAALAQGLWTAGVVATLALSHVAIARLLRGDTDPSHAAPAWIIPCVATLDIPVTGSHMPMPWAAEINLLASAIGAVLAVVLFTMIVIRLVHREPLAPAMTPSLMILVAPFAVGFLAYTNITGGIDRFAAMLFYFALFIFAVVAPKVFCRGARFSPAWWAVGFPMAALANAALKYAQAQGGMPLEVLAVGLLGFLSAVLGVLTLQTLRAMLSGALLK